MPGNERLLPPLSLSVSAGVAVLIPPLPFPLGRITLDHVVLSPSIPTATELQLPMLVMAW